MTSTINNSSTLTNFFSDFCDMEKEWDISELGFRSTEIFGESSTQTHWRTSVDVRGFSSDDIWVGSDGKRVQIVAKKLHGNNSSEIKKTVSLPDYVDKDSLETELTENVLVIKALLTKDVKHQLEEKYVVPDWIMPELREMMQTPCLKILHSQAHLEKRGDGSQTFCKEIPLCEFTLDEVEVKRFGDKVEVLAEHKKNQKGQVTHRKIQCQFSLPKGTGELTGRLLDNGNLCLEAPICKRSILVEKHL